MSQQQASIPASIPMIAASHLQFHRWATQRIVEAARQLSAEQLNKDHGTSFKSIFGTLTHIYQADSAWFGRIHGNPDSQTATYPPKRDLAGLTADWFALLDRAVEWSAKLSEAEWSKVISYKDSKGNSHETPLLPIVLHLVNHGSYHRGQVASLLRQTGVAPPSTDLIAFYRQAFAQKA
jgi:uncharacterized damage-inducible protein DinB